PTWPLAVWPSACCTWNWTSSAVTWRPEPPRGYGAPQGAGAAAVLAQRSQLREVAGRNRPVLLVGHRRSLLGTECLGLPAPGAEAAARRRVERRGHIAFEPDAADRGAELGHVRHRGEQGAGVRVGRTLIDLLARPLLHDLAQVHHAHALTAVAHDSQ